MNGEERIISGTIAEGGQRLDKALADASGLSRERVKALIGEQAVLIAGKPVATASASRNPERRSGLSIVPCHIC